MLEGALNNLGRWWDGSSAEAKAQAEREAKALAQKREAADAMIAVAVGAAYADGQVQPEEKAAMVKLFTIHPLLKLFPLPQNAEKQNALSAVCDMDVGMGQDNCLVELTEMIRAGATKEERITVLRAGVMLARSANGTPGEAAIHPSEEAWLLRCAATFGITREDVGF